MADPRNAQIRQFLVRRAALAAQDVDRQRRALADRGDAPGIMQERHEQAPGARIGIGAGAFERRGDQPVALHRRIPAAKHVAARVNENARIGSGAITRLRLCDRQQVAFAGQPVLHVDPRRARCLRAGDRGADGRRIGAVPRFHVYGDGQVGHRQDSRKIGKRIVEREILSIGAPLRPRDAEAAGGDRFRARHHDCPRAPRVPDVDEDQRVAGDVQCAEFSSLVGHQKPSRLSSSSLIGRP